MNVVLILWDINTVLINLLRQLKSFEKEIYEFYFLFPAKSLPLHCVVESVPSLQASFQLDSRSPWRRRPNIETDSYVIIPAATPFCDIVTIALQRLGYSSDISNTAKGMSHVMSPRCKLIWLIFLLLILRSDNNQKLEAAFTWQNHRQHADFSQRDSRRVDLKCDSENYNYTYEAHVIGWN